MHDRQASTPSTMSDSSDKGCARIAIDRGGTFTDAICSRPGEEDIVIKVGCAATAIVEDRPAWRSLKPRAELEF